jgi:hypothetical protein
MPPYWRRTPLHAVALHHCQRCLTALFARLDLHPAMTPKRLAHYVRHSVVVLKNFRLRSCHEGVC